MINYLNPPSVSIWKYVNDTALAEVVPKGTTSTFQEAIAEGERVSMTNKLQLNAEKCKEVIIDFKVARNEFDPIVINTRELCLVEYAEIYSVINTIKKVNKCLYFLVLLRRA